ncbi:MAG TPA: putative methyltransferase, partial [Aquificaceae bacterium]|nr:putative methyltransferase [Aquificaceae bacterium]
METLSHIAREVYEKTGVRLHGRNVERVLSAVLVSGDFWEIVDLSDLPVPATAGVVKKLVEEGILSITDTEDII